MKHVRLNSIKKFSWQKPGQRATRRVVKFALKINIWGCLSSKGFGKIKYFNGNLNSNFLCNNIYQTCLLPTAREHFRRNEEWSLMEDNDPKHCSDRTKAWKQQRNIINLPYPSSSLDIDPIENLWTLLKTRVLRKKPKILSTLVKSIKKEWKSLPKELAANLISSMPDRVNTLLESQGDYTMH